MAFVTTGHWGRAQTLTSGGKDGSEGQRQTQRQRMGAWWGNQAVGEGPGQVASAAGKVEMPRSVCKQRGVGSWTGQHREGRRGKEPCDGPW